MGRSLLVRAAVLIVAGAVAGLIYGHFREQTSPLVSTLITPVATTAPFNGAERAQAPNTPKNKPMMIHPAKATFLMDSLGRGAPGAIGRPKDRDRSLSWASSGMGLVAAAGGPGR